MDVVVGFLRLVAWLLRALWWLLVGTVRLLVRLRLARKHAHGTARWATWWEQWRSNALSGDGIVLGQGPFGRFIRYPLDGSINVTSAPGGGKGIGVVVPNLLTYPGSMVVTDPKGENFAITQRYRRTIGKVRLLSPLDAAHSDRLNPMDSIRTGTLMEVDDAAALAGLMVKPEHDEHWSDKSISFLKAAILRALEEPPETRTLAYVRTLSVGSPETFLATLEEIAEEAKSPVARETASGLLTSARNENGFTPEFLSVLSTVHKATEPWATNSPSGKLGSYSTFSLEELVEGISTVYLAVPEEFLDSYALWLRVMVGTVLNTLTRQKEHAPKHKVVLMLDEVRALGKLDKLSQLSGMLRTYCTPVLIWQNLPQIRAVYGADADAFLATTTCKAFFGCEDNQTAQYVAEMVGTTTTLSSSSGSSRHADDLFAGNHQHGRAESGYWLLDPAEIQRLPAWKMIIKMRGLPFPVMARRLDYRKVQAWAGRWDAWRADRPSQPPAPPPTRRLPPSNVVPMTPPPVLPSTLGLHAHR